MPNLTKNILLWLVIAMVLMSVFNNFTNPHSGSTSEIDYSTFLSQVKNGNIASVEIDNEIARLKLASRGVEIDELTERQRDYLASWNQGT